jgi:hypothetical protein
MDTLASLRQRQGKSVKEYTTKFRKMVIMLCIYPNDQDVLLKYLRGLRSHFQKKVMLFKPETVDEACVQEKYLDNIIHKKVNPSGCKYKYNQDSSKEGKKKENTRRRQPLHINARIQTTIAHQFKDPKNHFNHHNIDGHI